MSGTEVTKPAPAGREEGGALPPDESNHRKDRTMNTPSNRLIAVEIPQEALEDILRILEGLEAPAPTPSYAELPVGSSVRLTVQWQTNDGSDVKQGPWYVLLVKNKTGFWTATGSSGSFNSPDDFAKKSQLHVLKSEIFQEDEEEETPEAALRRVLWGEDCCCELCRFAAKLEAALR